MVPPYPASPQNFGYRRGGRKSKVTVTERPPQGVPGSADAAEHWLANQDRTGVPLGVPGSADAAEHWLANDNRTGVPLGVPGSADAAEKWLAGNSR